LFNDKITINITSPKPQPSDTSARKVDLNKSSVGDKIKNDSSFSYLKEKIINKITSNDQKESNSKISLKNP
jgi:hypothetical protein